MLANRTGKDATVARIELLLQKQRLKGLISAIVDVVDENGNGPEEMEEAPDEDVMPRLKEAKYFMASIQAFRRFAEDLRMFVFPIMGLYIRTIIRWNSRSIPAGQGSDSHPMSSPMGNSRFLRERSARIY
jgi:hypothetical protein